MCNTTHSQLRDMQYEKWCSGASVELIKTCNLNQPADNNNQEWSTDISSLAVYPWPGGFIGQTCHCSLASPHMLFLSEPHLWLRGNISISAAYSFPAKRALFMILLSCYGHSVQLISVEWWKFICKHHPKNTAILLALVPILGENGS